MYASRAIFGKQQSQMCKSLSKIDRSEVALRQQGFIRSFHNSGIESHPLGRLVTGGPVPPSNIWKALIFTGAFSIGTFIGVSIMEYENSRRAMIDQGRPSARNSWEKLKDKISDYWNGLSAGEKVFAPICAVNILVFGLWRIPSLGNTMINYFTSSPVARAVCWPMFLSTFSHISAFHLGANMYVLHSFTELAVHSLGKEQFLAVYLTAGVISSMSSILFKAISLQGGLSLGASGAIMAILAYVSTKYPDARLGIIFLPGPTFTAGVAIKVVMGIDLAGCILGWKMFDHAAHLGGAIFGVMWAYFGIDLWQKRLPFISFYDNLRKSK